MMVVMTIQEFTPKKSKRKGEIEVEVVKGRMLMR